MVGLREDTELSESPSFSFLNVGMSEIRDLPFEISNYQPISLLSNIEKIYEKMMYSWLMGVLNQFNQIYIRQLGFRKAHSTIKHPD